MISLKLSKTGCETVPYNAVTTPAYIHKNFLSSYPDYRAVSHWHEELELIYLLSGTMDYAVGIERISLQAGEGILVSPGHIHYGYSLTHEECEFYCVLVHPKMLHAIGIMEHACASAYCKLSPSIAWQAEILHSIATIYQKRSSTISHYVILHEILGIWITLYEHRSIDAEQMSFHDPHISILQNMLGKIQREYAESLTLADIAEAGPVSKSSCLNIFRDYLSSTPMAHLNAYRLKLASEQLLFTDATITEIAFAVGFQSASYFTRLFRQAYGMTPREYRQGHIT